MRTRKIRPRDLQTASKNALEAYERAIRRHETLGSQPPEDWPAIEEFYKRGRMKLIERLCLLESALQEQKALVKQLTKKDYKPTKGLARHLSDGAGAGY